MKSKGSSPTKAQKDHWNWMSSRGCAVCGNHSEIHHIRGAKFRLKVKGIKTQVGNDYVLPLCYWHHRDGDNPSNVTDWKHRFEQEHGRQCDMVRHLYDEYCQDVGAVPFDLDILEALCADSRVDFDRSAYE